MGIKCFMLTPVLGDGAVQSYRRGDTGEVAPFLDYSLRGEPPVGAMWWCDWLDAWGYKLTLYPERADYPKRFFPDEQGRILCVMTPGGEWIIDSRCSNCTMPNDSEHHCWIRHGEPPNITVDKSGVTCAAGAGSIMAGTYHGFLRNGELIPA